MTSTVACRRRWFNQPSASRACRRLLKRDGGVGREFRQVVTFPWSPMSEEPGNASGAKPDGGGGSATSDGKSLGRHGG